MAQPRRAGARWVGVRGDDVAQRLLDAAVETIRLIRALPRDVAGKHTREQLVRAITSAGANYEEARRAESRRDFVHKVAIAAKEAGEALYWLKLCERLQPDGRWKALRGETDELVAILTASARTARRHS